MGGERFSHSAARAKRNYSATAERYWETLATMGRVISLSSLDLSNDLSTKLAQLAKPAGMEVGELRVFESH